MRFLADESCADGRLVDALREAGHDVRLVATDHRGADDDVVFAVAAADDRIVITRDRDFGKIVFARGVPTSGVVFVRWPVALRAQLPARVVGLVDEMGERLRGAFVVLRPDRVRVHHRPPP